MALLSQLLDLPDLGLRLIKAGPGDPEISWVSTTELLDLGKYLEGGEVLLTTGLAFTAGDPRWRDFVASLNRARIAAIGFGIGVNHDRVPRELIQAATQYRVALFEIPLPTPFVAISKAAAGLLRADELRAARGALQVQQRLLDGARGDQDPAEVLAVMAQATGRHLALVTTDGTLVASTAGFAAQHGKIDYIDLDRDATLRLGVAGNAPLSPEGNAIIAAGSMVLGLGLHGGRADELRERERWERLALGLLEGRHGPEAIEILASTSTRQPAAPARLRVIAVQGGAEDVAAWRKRPRSGLDRLVAPDRGPAPAPGIGLAWQVCSDTEDAVAAALAAAASHGLDAAVGRSVPATDAPVSRRSAQGRLRALSPTAPLYRAPRVPVVVWADRDAPLFEALVGLTQAGAARALGRQVLGPLSNEPVTPADVVSGASVAAPDGSNPETELSAAERAQLRATLTAVFEHDGGRGPAATALGIHRNTLRDRLTRIERITGRSLADADDRAELWFALKLEELQG
ncbi:PucR family transcriptional regulator [Leucobacter sp. HY1910]